jgi:hypothetical protein
MNELIERISYGVLSSFIGAGIAMAILFWTDGNYEYKFFMIFIIPSFLLGLVIGKSFYESVWEIFKAIW